MWKKRRMVAGLGPFKKEITESKQEVFAGA